MTKNKEQNTNNWSRLIVLILRFVLGSVFAFSGFVKAVDPWGVLYKFEDYQAVLGWDWLSPFLLFGAFVVSIFEFLLGVCLIVGAYRRVSVWLSLLFMLVMTPLTLWLAVTGAVPDCGCFGEAIIMSNWTTFFKNIVLLIIVIYLIRHNVKLPNFYSPSIQWIITSLTIIFITAIASYGYFYQPMIDFRPYKVGTSIAKAGEVNVDVDSFVFIYEKDGNLQEFKMNEVPEDTTWTFVERKYVGTNNPETNLESGIVVMEGDEDVTSEVIRQEGEQIILVFSDLDDINITYTYLINIIDDLARQLKVDVIGVTGATDEAIGEWKDMSMATYPIYRVEDTELKILARGKPAVVYTRDGKVVWKRTLQSLSAARVEEAIAGKGNMEWIAADYDGANRIKAYSFMYLLTMILILILNRSYAIYKFSTRMIKKNRNKNVTLQS